MSASAKAPISEASVGISAKLTGVRAENENEKHPFSSLQSRGMFVLVLG